MCTRVRNKRDTAGSSSLHDLSTARLAVLGHTFFTGSLLGGKSDRASHVVREIGRDKHYWRRRKRQVC